jgi:hypothetical protein
MTGPRLVWAVDPIAVELTGTYARDPYVPHIARSIAGRVEIDRPCGDSVSGSIVQLQPYVACVAAEESEVHATL